MLNGCRTSTLAVTHSRSGITIVSLCKYLYLSTAGLQFSDSAMYTAGYHQHHTVHEGFPFFNFSFVKAVGVCFLAVCEGTYPAVLVFCFLEELQREFTVTFQSHDVQKARRPYSFIEFGKDFYLC